MKGQAILVVDEQEISTKARQLATEAIMWAGISLHRLFNVLKWAICGRGRTRQGCTRPGSFPVSYCE